MQAHFTDVKTKIQKGEVVGKLIKELKIKSRSLDTCFHVPPLHRVLNMAGCQQIFNKYMK